MVIQACSLHDCIKPGDVLINPPWYWHGILNLGDRSKGDLVIGSPTRYGQGGRNAGSKAAFRTNWLFTINSVAMFVYRYGLIALKPGFKPNLQADIANNRRDRENKPLVKDFDDDASLFE